jgi:hypothetical protein
MIECRWRNDSVNNKKKTGPDISKILKSDLRILLSMHGITEMSVKLVCQFLSTRKSRDLFKNSAVGKVIEISDSVL